MVMQHLDLAHGRRDSPLFAESANMWNMKTADLGQELRRLRQEAGLTLRGLAATLGVSAAHLSDIEHNHRRPSDDLLRKIARALRKAGATFASRHGIGPRYPRVGRIDPRGPYAATHAETVRATASGHSSGS